MPPVWGLRTLQKKYIYNPLSAIVANFIYPHIVTQKAPYCLNDCWPVLIPFGKVSNKTADCGHLHWTSVRFGSIPSFKHIFVWTFISKILHHILVLKERFSFYNAHFNIFN